MQENKKIPIHHALKNKADKCVEVQYIRNEKLNKTYVTPIGTNAGLLYIEWVKNNKQKVKQASNGKIGYIHIHDMDVNGYVNFCRDYYAQYHLDALIIDVRNNNGGYVSPMILSILQRKRTGKVTTKYETTSDPFEASSGKYVFLCNEYTASDGDIFSQSVKVFNLGELIGQRTWGGVVGISVRNFFIDGGFASQPEYPIIFDSDPHIENKGVEPTIEVQNTPEDIINKKDAQLEIALGKALELASEKS